MRLKTTFSIFILLVSSQLLAQSHQGQIQNDKTPEQIERERLYQQRRDFEAEIEKQFEQSSDLIRQFFDEEELSQFHQNFRNMFKDFENMHDLDDKIFAPPGAQQLFRQTFNNSKMIEKTWEEGPKDNEVTLVLKIAQANNQPLNVSVENGNLKVNGTIKTERKNKAGHVVSSSVSTINIQESLGRSDINPNPINMTQDKNGHLNIIFEKLNGKKRVPLPYKDEAKNI